MRAVRSYLMIISERFTKEQWLWLRERVWMLYVLSSSIDHGVSLAVGKNVKTTLWHCKLGHLSESGMKILKSKNALIDMQDANFEFCEDCLYDKQKNLALWRMEETKSLKDWSWCIQMFWGPSSTKSFGGNSFFVILINDASRKTWIFNLKRKIRCLQDLQDMEDSCEEERLHKSNVGALTKFLWNWH